MIINKDGVISFNSNDADAEKLLAIVDKSNTERSRLVAEQIMVSPVPTLTFKDVIGMFDEVYNQSGAYTDPCSGLDACLRDARKDLKNNVDATVIRLIGSGIESGKIKIGDEKAVFTGNEFRLVRTVCVKP